MITGKPGSMFTAMTLSILLLLAACGPGPIQPAPAEIPGRVELNQTPYNDVPLGGGGTGTVDFHGTVYHFTIGGLGVDAGAVAVLQTLGEVYQLHDIASFPGIYRRTPDATAMAGQPSNGLWVQNQHAVIMHLVAPPQGHMPDIGTDALRVDLNQ
jgi:hypothetical protein